MIVRRTKESDIEAIMDIYAKARVFMAENGNPHQWIDGYPSLELVKGDIEKDGYVIIDKDNNVVGVFVFKENVQKDVYDNIDGKWLNNEPYAVIHRCATSSTGKGVGQFLLDWCWQKFGNIRIDTHKDNQPMAHLLKKNNYIYCGKVLYPTRNGERLAYHKIS